ncbi:MAG: peptide-methionine (S)-S-oxide reductase MsrA [Flavobacteriaceae bacterium]
MNKTDLQTATFANGCFWCTETVFLQLKGVIKVVSGYTGGFIKNPCYREVCNGVSGHAEAVQISFDPALISYKELLEVFFATHDPTTLNRQGYDVGTQYRSAIYYHDAAQKSMAEAVITDLNNSNVFDNEIVTEVSKAEVFYEAEIEHQDFYKNNPEFRYCSIIIDPKLEKLKTHYHDKLK